MSSTEHGEPVEAHTDVQAWADELISQHYQWQRSVVEAAWVLNDSPLKTELTLAWRSMAGQEDLVDALFTTLHGQIRTAIGPDRGIFASDITYWMAHILDERIAWENQKYGGPPP